MWLPLFICKLCVLYFLISGHLKRVPVCFAILYTVLNLHLVGSVNFKSYGTAFSPSELHFCKIIGFLVYSYYFSDSAAGVQWNLPYWDTMKPQRKRRELNQAFVTFRWLFNYLKFYRHVNKNDCFGERNIQIQTRGILWFLNNLSVFLNLYFPYWWGSEVWSRKFFAYVL